jgi:hypothetical protein
MLVVRVGHISQAWTTLILKWFFLAKVFSNDDGRSRPALKCIGIV